MGSRAEGEVLAPILDRKRADLNLQVGLLSEHEVTRLILRLATRMAERMGVEESASPELSALERDVRPERVLDRLERVRHEERPDEPPPTSRRGPHGH